MTPVRRDDLAGNILAFGESGSGDFETPMHLALRAGSPAIGRALRCEMKWACPRRSPPARFGPFMRTKSRRCRNPRNRRERARREGTRQV